MEALPEFVWHVLTALITALAAGFGSLLVWVALRFVRAVDQLVKEVGQLRLEHGQMQITVSAHDEEINTLKKKVFPITYDKPQGYEGDWNR